MITIKKPSIFVFVRVFTCKCYFRTRYLLVSVATSDADQYELLYGSGFEPRTYYTNRIHKSGSRSTKLVATYSTLNEYAFQAATQERFRYFFPRNKSEEYLDQFLVPAGHYEGNALPPGPRRHRARTANSSAATCTKHR